MIDITTRFDDFSFFFFLVLYSKGGEVDIHFWCFLCFISSHLGLFFIACLSSWYILLYCSYSYSYSYHHYYIATAHTDGNKLHLLLPTFCPLAPSDVFYDLIYLFPSSWC